MILPAFDSAVDNAIGINEPPLVQFVEPPHHRGPIRLAQVREARQHSPPRPSRKEPRRGVYVFGRALQTKFVGFPGRLRAPCPQSAPVGGIEPPIIGLTGRRLTVWPHRIKCLSQDGWS